MMVGMNREQLRRNRRNVSNLNHVAALYCIGFQLAVFLYVNAVKIGLNVPSWLDTLSEVPHQRPHRFHSLQ
jgi:hypothetical protein